MKAKIIGFISFLLFLSVIFSFGTSGEEIKFAPSTESAGYFALYDIDSDRFLMKKKIDSVISPSSTVKIMSGIIACEKLEKRVDETVTVTSKMLKGASGKSIGLSPGTTVKIKDLMFAAYSCGYNDAATVLSVIAAGSTEEMVDLMNSRASELQMYSTKYTNVTGLDDGKMKTTVRDTVNLAIYAAQNDLFLEVSSAYNYVVKYADGEERTAYGNNEIVNKNSLYYCASAKGMNSGATDSGACLVTYGEAKGKRLIAVAMGCLEENDSRFALIQNSLDWGYKNAYVTLASQNDFVGTVKVDLSQTDNKSVDLVLSEELIAFFDGSEDKELIRYTLITDSEALEAPVKKGECVGQYVVWYGNTVRGIANITVAETVEKSSFLGFVEGIENYFTGRAFIATAIILLVSIILFIFIPKIALLRRQKKRKYVKTRGGFNLKK